MMMTDDELRDLGDRWERWARYEDPSAFTTDDADALLGEVRELRVQQVRLIALVRQSRDRLAEVNGHYRELLALPGVQAIVLAHQAERERCRQDRDTDQLPGQLALDLDHDPDQLVLGGFDEALATPRRRQPRRTRRERPRVRGQAQARAARRGGPGGTPGHPGGPPQAYQDTAPVPPPPEAGPPRRQV